MRATHSIIAQLLLYACCPALHLASQSPPSSAQLPGPPLRVTTRLVQVNVVVLDKKGQAISDLKQADFELTEQGKAQTISAFSIESNLKAIGRAEALPPNTFSNMPARSGASQNLTILLFDTLNTAITDQMSAKAEVMRFLADIQPQDRVAIYGLGNSLRVLHDFTGSSEMLVRAIARYKARFSKEQAGSTPEIVDNTNLAASAQEAQIIEQMDKFLNESNRMAADEYIQRRMSLTLAALEAIANHVSGLSGRKSLVWISGAFPFSYGSDIFQVNQANVGSKNFAEVMARVTRAITSANVAIYPVDARGLMSVAAMTPSASATTVMSTRRQGQRMDSSAMDEVMSSRNTMQELAEKTGGRAIYNTSDVQGAIRRVLDDSRLVYTLAYYPAEKKFDGRFRQIKVSVNRPGVQLFYRRGYYALPDEPLDDAHRQSAISAAARSPLDLTALGFTAEVGKPAAASPQRMVSLDVDTNSILLEQQQEAWAGGVDVVFAQLDAVGNIITSIGRMVPLKLTADQRAQLPKDGLVLNAPLAIDPKCEQLRIILRDLNSGALGTLTIPLK